MGCRNGGVLEEEEELSAVTASLSDALLSTTMCIIGLPIDVHVRDGSIYSGIFFTACVEDDYAIVLKRVRMTKNGTYDSNVNDGSIIETLVIVAEDLVQVVAEGILLLTDVKHGNLSGDGRGALAVTDHFLEFQEIAEVTKLRKCNVDIKNISKLRLSAQVEIADGFAPKLPSPRNVLERKNGKTVDSRRQAKKDEVSILLNDGRRVGEDKSERKQNAYEDEPELGVLQTTLGVQQSNWSLDAGMTQLEVTEDINAKTISKVLPNGIACDSSAPSIDGKSSVAHTLADVFCSKAMSTSVQAVAPSAADSVSESCPRTSSNLTEVIPPKSSSCNKTAKL